jgi:hypothetical protein
MAEADTDPTRSDDAASKASSPWLLLEDVFQRWRVRLKSSHEAKGELEALLRDRDTRSRIRRVDTGGEEISDTTFLNALFWQDHGALLSVVPDADGVGDHLGIDYTDYADIYWDDYSPGWRWEFSVRRLDVERHERLYFPTPAPPSLGNEPTSPPTPPDETSAIPAADQPEERQRAARKSALVEKAITGCFPKGIPETLPNPELVQQIMKWLADYCKENTMPLPVISPTTILRASGRKDKDA